MGLDIRAASWAKFVEFADEYDEDKEGRYTHFSYINHHFPHAVLPVAHGHTYVVWSESEGTETFRFRAGSYSGYGVFRSTLAEFVGIGDLYGNGELWETVDDHSDKPFYELINFSDCEGTFFGPVCEKLYEDFLANRTNYAAWLANSNLEWESYYLNRYDDWLKAFEIAKDSGLVEFR